MKNPMPLIPVRTTLRLALGALALAWIVPAASAVEFDDVLYVYRADSIGPIKNLRVESEGIEKTTYQVRGGSTSSKPSVEIKEIHYGDAPKVWTEAREAMAKRQWQAAIKAFESAVSTHESAGKVRAWIVPAARFEQARCRLALAQGDPGSASAAVSAWTTWLDEYGDHRLAPQAYEYAGQAMLLAGDARGARANYEKLKAVVAEKKLHVLYRLKADLGVALAADALGDYATAIPAYGAVRATATSEAGYLKIAALKKQVEGIVYVAAAKRGDAMLSKAEASGQDEAFRQARQYFLGLGTEASGDPRISAIADIGVAICKLRGSQPREALRELAAAKVKHFAAGGEVAKALYYMARAARKLGHERQAKAFEAELQRMYPETIWARKTK